MQSKESNTPVVEKTANVAAENIKAFVAGGFGGVCAVLVGASSSIWAPPFELNTTFCCRQGHPFDLTKTRLQTAPPGTYTGAIDVVKKALARDGVTG